MANKKPSKKDDKQNEGNPNLIGEAGQVAGNTRDEGGGGMRGGGTGDRRAGSGRCRVVPTEPAITAVRTDRSGPTTRRDRHLSPARTD